MLEQISNDKIYAVIDYEDKYVQPLLLRALKSRLPPDLLVLVKSISDVPSDQQTKCLQWKQYEALDFDLAMSSPSTNLINSYVIRKALIRKHYLSNTVSHWASKHPESSLTDHINPGVEFELDFAEFLDDALVEAWELREAFEKNEGVERSEREWWILKPGMSDRGQGIRLFSTEEELTSIFEAWDPPSDDEDEDEDDDDNDDGDDEDSDSATHSSDERDTTCPTGDDAKDARDNGIITSQLRHFISQPYIHPPLLLPPPHPSSNRKFHIRTYVLAAGALKIFVYKPMLALFAATPYSPPWASPTGDPNNDLGAHLTNTCLQTGEREGSVHSFWSLPSDDVSADLPQNWKENVFAQICAVTGEIFEAAARAMTIHFQPLPNAFEVFGVDFLVDAQGKASLMEVNAFPDFKQTGEELDWVIQGLFEGVVDVAVKPFFGVEDRDEEGEKRGDMVEVLDVDLGRR